MTVMPSNSSVDHAVADEWRRRKRVFRLYLSLLAIPIAAAAYAVAYGISQQEAVVSSVAPQVEKNVVARVEKSVAARASQEARSAAKEEVGTSLRQVQGQVEDLRKTQTRYAQMLAIRPPQNDGALLEQLAQINRKLDNLDARLKALEHRAVQAQPGLPLHPEFSHPVKPTPVPKPPG